MYRIQELTNKYHKYIVIFLLTFISVFCFYFYFQNNLNLAYGDAVSRMNISRKIIDNLTPGLAQLGNVWLPLPQLLMLSLIWSKYFWHTGIAGGIVSMVSYIIGGYFLYKTAKIITNSIVASFFSVLVYALNINVMYLQSTAMSEPIFICSIILCMYFFTRWIQSDNKMQYLILAALTISAATLIRYEALALLAASVPVVFLYSWKKTGTYHKAEGHTILYTLLASLGFAIWTLYLAVIFGDPLYWKNYYAGSQTVTTATAKVQTYVFHLNIFQAFWKYFTAVVWMNGLIPTILAVLAIPIWIIEYKRNKSYYFIPVIIALSMFGFMILTLQRNTPINQPDLTVASLFTPKTNHFPEFNIRYGLIMLPIVSLLTVYLFKIRYAVVKVFLYVLFSIQIFSYFYPTYTVIFQLPLSMNGNSYQGNVRERSMKDWLKQHYDRGFIIISATKHDPQMFQLGLNYRSYIHEGTGKYWKESWKNPQRYATWVVFDANNTEDQVTKYISKSSALKAYFNLVYENDGMKIYKIKSKPDVAI